MSTVTAPHPMIEPGAAALVLGLGKTGLSCARYLRRKGLRVRVADTRQAPPAGEQLQADHPEVELRRGSFDSSLLEEMSQVVISPGISRREPVVAEAERLRLPVIGDIELFAREASAPVAAITGTNGKSTVTTLLAGFAKAAGRHVLSGGNLGCPALDLLETDAPDLYVLELSSFQLESCYSLQTITATVLNVTPDHLDRYESMEEYAATKSRIFDRCRTAVVNIDDPYVRSMPRSGQRVLSFSLLDPGADYCLTREPDPVLVCRGEPLLPFKQMKITGRHNAANALAALAMSEALGLSRGPALEVLTRFAGLPHRAQWVAEVGGVRFVNDSKGTNVGATVASVAGMDGPLVLIAGGDAKNQDFEALQAACRGKVRHAVLIGRDADKLESVLAGHCSTQRATDMASAVRAARAAAMPGDTVLLSPACASLDMFRDYTHRGDEFMAAGGGLAA